MIVQGQTALDQVCLDGRADMIRPLIQEFNMDPNTQDPDVSMEVKFV